MDLEFLEAFKEEWKPVSKAALIAWLVFYGLFLLHALTNKSGFLIIDYVFLPIHEGGHLLFGYPKIRSQNPFDNEIADSLL